MKPPNYFKENLQLCRYFVNFEFSRWDRYLGMTAPMTQVPMTTDYDYFLTKSIRPDTKKRKPR